MKQAHRLLRAGVPVWVRMDSAHHGRDAVHAAITGGAQVSVTVRANSPVKAAIAGVDQDAWTTIKYPDAIFDETTGTWVSRAEVAEVPFTAFPSRKEADQVPGRLVVRRIPDVHADAKTAAGQGTLFDVWRFHAFFTTAPPTRSTPSPRTRRTVGTPSSNRSGDSTADLKNSALAHRPSGKFTTNAAWLVLAVIAFNLTCASATMTGDPALTKSATATIHRKLLTVSARIASSARRITLHLPDAWPWHEAWTRLFNRVADLPAATAS